MPVKPYYAEGGIIIINSDCREILPHLEPVDLVLTDPPYGMKVDTGKFQRIGRPDYEWHDVEHAGADWMADVLALNKPTVLFGANAYASKLPNHPGWIVWDKQCDGFAQGSPAELAWTNFLRNLRMFRLNYRGFTTAFDPKKHPMQKPVRLMLWILSLDETPQGTILDPFMGSGTTLVAARDLGRHAIGVEIERRYCDIAIERLRQCALPLSVEQRSSTPEQEGLYGTSAK